MRGVSEVSADDYYRTTAAWRSTWVLRTAGGARPVCVAPPCVSVRAVRAVHGMEFRGEHAYTQARGRMVAGMYFDPANPLACVQHGQLPGCMGWVGALDIRQHRRKKKQIVYRVPRAPIR